jgi:hypothetical protein
VTKPTPKTGIAGRFFENDKQVAAHEHATASARGQAQDFSARVATEVAVAVRKVLSGYMDVSREKLVAEVGALVLKRAYAAHYEHQYERSFDWELDRIVHDERRQKAEARKKAKREAWIAAARTERINAMLGLNQQQGDDRAGVQQ